MQTLQPNLARLWLGVFFLSLSASSHGQIAVDETPEHAPRYGTAERVHYRVGAEINATGGPCRKIIAMVAVPFECDEQDVTLVDKDFSAHVREDNVDFRNLQGGATQMVITIPFLPAGAKAHAIYTFEVTTRPILPPEETAQLAIPKRTTTKLRRFINGSPYIEVKHNRVRSLAKDIAKEVPDDASDWKRIEAIYDYLLDNIRYEEGPDKSALNTLRDGFADCQGRSALFIALCRASKIPARMVWVDGHCYPEFYLEHAEGEGNWYPCESAGDRAFGEMPLARTILQKGDKFRVPERGGEWLRYASDFLVGTPVAGSRPPKVKYIRGYVTE